jgi:N6-adenosine-specific RNA methylase IME4
MDATPDRVVIDPEFKALCPPLAAEERAQLEENCRRWGIRDPLVLWRGVLLDGHNRYEIAVGSDLAFKTTDVELPDRDAALDWIIRNQLGRRNLTPEQASYLRGKQYEREKLGHGGERRSSGHCDHLNQGKAQDRLADTHKVSAKTIQRDAAFARAVDKLAEVAGDEARSAILTRDAPVSKKEAVSLAKTAEDLPEFAAGVMQSLAHGKAKDFREAVRKQKQSQKTEERRTVSLAAQVSGRFPVILADCPWRYSNSGFDESAESHYPTMAVEDICALPVPDKVTAAAVLFLWATNPLLPEALRVMSAWGFEYKTNIAWVKDKPINIGFHAYGQHELLLIGTRGGMMPDRSGIGPSVLRAVVREHSRKPDEAHERVMAMYPEGPYLELFARPHDEDRLRLLRDQGWEFFGNEIDPDAV